MPGPRKVHLSPVPRLGGIAIFAGFSAGLVATILMGIERYPEEVERLQVFMVAATILVIAMFLDDLWGLKPVTKLVVQVAVALMVAFPAILQRGSAVYIGSISWPLGGTLQLPLEVAIPLTVLWFVGMMNTLNWLDGLDGLAGGVTLVASAILFVHTWLLEQYTIALLPLLLAASCVGFLRYNLHPATIMMGDSGAMFLGFALATISIIGGAKIGTALLTLGVPIIDVAWVILYRIRHRRSPMAADRTHLHHRLLALGLSQRQVVAIYYGLSAGFGVLAVFLPSGLLKLVALSVLGLVVLAFLAYAAAKRPYLL
jgi:UDP-N-acetylmuramyl pentapeptide phosphotransferase/UDP-N-acetylglucosamine-1-phosphate transferase